MFRTTRPLTRLVLIVALVPATATAQTIPFEESTRRAAQQLAEAQSRASEPPRTGQVPRDAIPTGTDGRCSEESAARARGKPVTFADLSSSVVGAPASLFGKPTARLNVGDAVSVIDADGGCTKGRIAELTSSSLTLLVDKRERRTFPAETVQRIVVRDSLWDGALIGFAYGAISATVITTVGVVFVAGKFLCGEKPGYSCNDSPDYSGVPSVFFELVALFGGIGAATGAGIDALNKETINVSPPQGARLTVSPVISTARQAVLVSIRF